MNKIKVFIVTLLVTVLAVSPVVYGAAVSPTKKRINPDNTTVTSAQKEYVYTGEPFGLDLIVVCDGRTLIEGTDYLSISAKINDIGLQTVDVQVIGIGHYEGTLQYKITVYVKDGRVQPTTIKPTTKPIVTKKTQKLKNTKKRKVKYKKVKRKRVKIKLRVKSTGNGKIQYKRISKKLKVSKKGVVYIRKGTKKGKYYVKVRARATRDYKQTKWKKIKIVVK